MSTDKKARERHLVRHAQKIGAGFPQGTLIDHERPDFLIAGGAVGIEVTELFHPAVPNDFSTKQIERCQRDVMLLARRLYTEAGHPPVDVLAYFSHERVRTLGRTLIAIPRALRETDPWDRICRHESNPTAVAVVTLPVA